MPLDKTFPVIVRADGIRLWDADGKEYIDGTSGAISVASVGHGRREVADAIHAQVVRMDDVHDNEFHNEPAHALATKVTEFAGGEFSRAVVFSSGSEAVESAIEACRRSPRPGCASTGAPSWSAASEASTARRCTRWVSGTWPHASRGTRDTWPCLTAKIPAPYCYRCPLGKTYPDCAVACAPRARDHDPGARAENVSAFIAEPVVGAAAPALTPPAGYYEAIREICDRYGVLWIADEIVTGFGRTGRNMGYMHWDAQPDILVVAKGMSGGYVPLSGLIISEKVVKPFEEQQARFTHGLTYQNHPVGVRRRAGGGRHHRAGGPGGQNAATRGAYLEASACARWSRALPIVGETARQAACCGARSSIDRPGVACPVRPRVWASGVKCAHAGRPRERAGPLPERRQRRARVTRCSISPPLIVTREDIDEIVARLAARRWRPVQAEVLARAGCAGICHLGPGATPPKSRRRGDGREDVLRAARLAETPDAGVGQQPDRSRRSAWRSRGARWGARRTRAYGWQPAPAGAGRDPADHRGRPSARCRRRRLGRPIWSSSAWSPASPSAVPAAGPRGLGRQPRGSSRSRARPEADTRGRRTSCARLARAARSAPNVAPKIPATAPGLEAFEALVAEGCPTIVTEVFSLAQFVEVAERYLQVTGRTSIRPPFFMSPITGIFGDHLKAVAKQDGLDVDAADMELAGVALSRECYRIAGERGYPVTLLCGGARIPLDLTGLVGGALHATINWSTFAEVMASPEPFAEGLEE